MRIVFSTLLALAFSTQIPAQAPDKPKADPNLKGASLDKVVCRISAPTGSLIANTKECRTKREWDAMRVDTMHILQSGSCASAESGVCH